MAWNEPGKGGQQGGNQDGPPELDKVFKDLSDKLSGLFGKKKSNPASSGGGSSAPTNFKPFIIGGVILLLVIWVLSGIFIVSPAEKAVVLQFGKYETTVGPGPHWIPRLIRSETKVNVQEISNYSYSAQMLTKDQNIVDVAVSVQYRVGDVRDYLYNLVNATNSVQQATASALRQVMGVTTLDQVLTSGRAVVRQAVMQQLEKILQIYHAGIEITDVALQPAKAPAEVKDAFDDAIKAQEDEQRYQNQAEAYANGVLPIAEGRAKRITAEAKAYSQQVVLQADAAVAQFNAIYPVYKDAPRVTRERLYLTAIENVLRHSSKVFVDTKGNNNNLMYLPLDQLVAKEEKKLTEKNDTDTVTAQELDQSGVLQNSYENPLSRSGALNNNSSTVNPDSLVGQGARP
jgi:membrane protease subunit HflK